MQLLKRIVLVVTFSIVSNNVHGQENGQQISDPAENVRSIRQVASSENTTQAPAAEKPLPVTASFSLKDLILILMTKHGEARTALAFNSLDKKSLGEIMKILLVEVDSALAEDIVAMQHHAQNSDKPLVAVIARIVTGDGSVSKDIFTWDEKLRKFPWWARIRQRMFVNLDRYVATYKLEV
ncbi:uncharacterized protein LOC110844077 [Folsomia candida]|nr:uncharacterized protein LOC110844077 [Folsomia candida]